MSGRQRAVGMQGADWSVRTDGGIGADVGSIGNPYPKRTKLSLGLVPSMGNVREVERKPHFTFSSVTLLIDPWHKTSTQAP